MRREEKNGGPMQGRLHIKTTQIPPFFCCIPVFQSLLSLCIPLSFANFSHLRKKFARLRIIVVFLFVFFFLIFVCIKGHPSSDSGPSKEISWKESKLKSIIAACGKIHSAYCCFDHWTVKNQVHLYENFPRNCCFSRYFQNIHTTSVPSSLLFLL